MRNEDIDKQIENLENEIPNEKEAVKELATLYMEIQVLSNELEQLNKEGFNKEFEKKQKELEEKQRKANQKENKMSKKAIQNAKTIAIFGLVKKGIEPTISVLKPTFENLKQQNPGLLKLLEENKLKFNKENIKEKPKAKLNKSGLFDEMIGAAYKEMKKAEHRQLNAKTDMLNAPVRTKN